MCENYAARNPCAVQGCTNIGRPQICPADGAYHGHGRIHYEHCHSDLKFSDRCWEFVCDEHYAVLCEARRRWESRKGEMP